MVLGKVRLKHIPPRSTVCAVSLARHDRARTGILRTVHFCASVHPLAMFSSAVYGARVHRAGY